MKKLLYIVTVFLYVTMSCGVVIHLHYCMGRFQSFDLLASQKNECGKCGMPMDQSKNCCKDEVKIVKLQDDQNTSTVSYTLKNTEAPAMIPSDFMAVASITSDKLQGEKDYAPPDFPGQDAYLHNCVFRI